MKINRKKSGIIFYKRRKSKKNSNHKEEILGFPIVDEYKYLGLWIDETMSFDKQIIETEKKIEKGMKMMQIMRWKRTTLWKQTYAWMTYIVPHFRYGALIYNGIRVYNNKKKNKAVEKMKILLNKTVKDLYDFPKNTPNITLDKIMGNWNLKTP